MFNKHRIWERAQAGELDYRIDAKRKKDRPLIDHRGTECWVTELLFVTDRRYPPGDFRHNVVREANRHRTDAGVFCGSGKWDPGKADLQIEGRLYARYQTKRGRKPRCEICETGPMIWPWHRFVDSKQYRPSAWRCLWVRIHTMIKS